MIGQEKLFSKIDKLIESEFPRFVLLVGQVGSGKKLVAKEISNKLGYPLVSIGTGVDEIREVITNSYRNTEPIIYIIPDTDKMSVAAKNALLKITEEPPQKAYFIMTVSNTSNTLDTILSRACVLKMDCYNKEELLMYVRLKYSISNEQLENFVVNTANVPKDIDVLMSYENLEEYSKFVDNLCNHIHTVSSANVFKIEQKLALKKDEEKWDLLLTLQALKHKYYVKFIETKETQYYQCYQEVCYTIYELNYKNSVNKQYCLDELILKIREVWR